MKQETIELIGNLIWIPITFWGAWRIWKDAHNPEWW
jgi:hypothetical protein